MRIHLSDHFTYGKLLRFAAEALAFALTLCFFARNRGKYRYA